MRPIILNHIALHTHQSLLQQVNLSPTSNAHQWRRSLALHLTSQQSSPNQASNHCQFRNRSSHNELSKLSSRKCKPNNSLLPSHHNQFSPRNQLSRHSQSNLPYPQTRRLHRFRVDLIPRNTMTRSWTPLRGSGTPLYLR